MVTGGTLIAGVIMIACMMHHEKKVELEKKQLEDEITELKDEVRELQRKQYKR
jgi:hypothetical protein